MSFITEDKQFSRGRFAAEEGRGVWERRKWEHNYTERERMKAKECRKKGRNGKEWDEKSCASFF